MNVCTLKSPRGQLFLSTFLFSFVTVIQVWILEVYCSYILEFLITPALVTPLWQVHCLPVFCAINTLMSTATKPVEGGCIGLMYRYTKRRIFTLNSREYEIFIRISGEREPCVLLGQPDRNATSGLIFHESKERRSKLYSAAEMNPKYITHLTGRTGVGAGKPYCFWVASSLAGGRLAGCTPSRGGQLYVVLND